MLSYSQAEANAQIRVFADGYRWSRARYLRYPHKFPFVDKALVCNL